MEYHPLDAEKNEIRVLRPIIDGEYIASAKEGNNPEQLLRVKMKTVSLDDYTQTSQIHMKAQGTTIYKRNSFYGQHLKVEGQDQWTNNEERANGLQNINQNVTALLTAEGFGRWTWGDYFTLSYTWGDSTSKRKISVNGHVMEVTRNLWEYLHHASMDEYYKTEKVWLWIDAICINQQDVEEQNAQVKRMKNIYDQSLGCVAWLGPASDDSDKAIDMLKFFAEQQVNNATEGIEYMSKVRSSILADKAEASFSLGAWKAFGDLICRPYWSRLWVIQEIVLSSTALNIVCGEKSIPWPLFCYALSILTYDFKVITLAVQSDPEDEKGRKCKRILDQLSRLQQLNLCNFWYESGIKPSHLGAVLPMSRTANQTDARDKVYGILSLVDPKIVKLIEPNYNLTIEQVYIDFAKASIMGTGSLDIICHSRFDREEGRQLPTWVPDWRDGEIVGQEFTTSVPYQASRDRKCDPSFKGDALTLQGFVFDKVDGLGATRDITSTPTRFLFDVIQSKQTTNAFRSEADTRESLWRSFVANRDGHGELLLDSLAGLLDIPWNTGAELLWGFSEFRERNKSLLICGCELQSYFPVVDNADFEYNSAWIEMATLRLANVFMGRRLITTDKGYIGVAPNRARQGDLIVIAFGSSVPFVLRPQEHGGKYTFVGEAYVHGIMEGQGMEWLETGQCRAREFTIV